MAESQNLQRWSEQDRITGFTTGTTFCLIEYTGDTTNGAVSNKIMSAEDFFALPALQNTYTNSTLTDTALGGIPSGITFTEKTVTEMFDMLLYPTKYPILLTPSHTSFTVAPTRLLYKVGEIGSINFSSVFNRGSISPQYNASEPYRSGSPVSHNFSGTGLTASITTNTTDYASVSNYTFGLGYQTWSCSVTYSAGEQPYDNKGGVYDAPLSSGTTSPTKIITIEGVYPLFATTSSISFLTEQGLVSMKTGNNIILSLVAETGGNKQKFEIPTAWTGSPTNKPLIGVKVLNTVSGLYEYPGGSSASSLSYWTTSLVTEEIQSQTITYTKYQYNQDDRGSVTIQLIF